MKQVFRRLPPVCALDSHSRTGQTPLGVEYQTAIEQGAQWDADAAIVSTWHWIRGSMAGVVCLFVCLFLSFFVSLVGWFFGCSFSCFALPEPLVCVFFKRAG